MLSPKMDDALNKQLNEELFSAYLYQSMAAYFEANGLEGMASWMDMQREEEMLHARKFYDYINERGGRVKLQALGAPKIEWENPIDVFKDALEHEQHITKCITDLYYLARDERDPTTDIFLQWFITEQAEEEDSVQKVIDKLELVKNANNGTFLMDRELSKRATAAPADDAATE